MLAVCQIVCCLWNSYPLGSYLCCEMKIKNSLAVGVCLLEFNPRLEAALVLTTVQWSRTGAFYTPLTMAARPV